MVEIMKKFNNYRLNIFKILPAIVMLMFSIACNTDELKNLDNPKVGIDDTKLNRGYLFANAQLLMSNQAYDGEKNIYGGYMQYYATYSIIMVGDRYLYEQPRNDDLWDAYTEEIKHLEQLLYLLNSDEENLPDLVNKIAQTRILRVYAYHRITDAYGDVPYSEAGKAAIDATYFPAYDTQQSIYADMLRELEQAAVALTSSGEIFSAEDFLFNGDFEKWKKFAYSLMLRLAMRVSKADPAMAQEYITKAVNGGLMESNLDVAMIRHADGPQEKNQQPRSRSIILRDPEKYTKLGETFINWLIDQNDPRLMVYSGGVLDESVTGFTSTDMNIFWYQDGIWKLDPADQAGHPHGTTIVSIEQDYGIASFEDMQHAYSRPNPKMIAFDKPHVLMNYSEVQFLLAEAAIEGWASGDPADYYEAGVRAAMTQYGVYDPDLIVADAEIDAFLAVHPFDPAEGKKMIGEQYWLATYLNEQEAWSNWRRTGYPELTPNVDADIPRRNEYQEAERSINQANYQDAVSRLSNGDTFYSRVWWDTP
jgi:hypothetical protein